ncbi:MAG: CBS domain-containing protein [Woeseiaceae bacterium]|nr:CBS domain-containing protein [Woeseiaceae bacterium]
MSTAPYIPVSKVMNEEVTFVSGLTDVLEALKTMKRNKVTYLMIERRTDEDEYGMISFSDIAKHVIAENRAPERVDVHEIMAKPVVSVRPEMDIRYCARLFNNVGISHAPVIKHGEVVGIVSYYHLVLEALDLD